MIIFFNQNFFLKVILNWSKSQTKQLNNIFGYMRATLASKIVFQQKMLIIHFLI